MDISNTEYSYTSINNIKYIIYVDYLDFNKIIQITFSRVDGSNFYRGETIISNFLEIEFPIDILVKLIDKVIKNGSFILNESFSTLLLTINNDLFSESLIITLHANEKPDTKETEKIIYSNTSTATELLGKVIELINRNETLILDKLRYSSEKCQNYETLYKELVNISNKNISSILTNLVKILNNLIEDQFKIENCKETEDIVSASIIEQNCNKYCRQLKNLQSQNVSIISQTNDIKIKQIKYFDLKISNVEQSLIFESVLDNKLILLTIQECLISKYNYGKNYSSKSSTIKLWDLYKKSNILTIKDNPEENNYAYHYFSYKYSDNFIMLMTLASEVYSISIYSERNEFCNILITFELGNTPSFPFMVFDIVSNDIAIANFKTHPEILNSRGKLLRVISNPVTEPIQSVKSYIQRKNTCFIINTESGINFFDFTNEKQLGQIKCKDHNHSSEKVYPDFNYFICYGEEKMTIWNLTNFELIKEIRLFYNPSSCYFISKNLFFIELVKKLALVSIENPIDHIKVIKFDSKDNLSCGLEGTKLSKDREIMFQKESDKLVFIDINYENTN